MDAYLAVRIFPKKLSWILSFTAVYLILIGAFLVIWRLAPNLSLTVFLLASIWHFGKLDANTQLKNSSSISWKIFFGLTVPTNLAFFHTNEVRVLLEMLTLENVDLIVDSLAHGWWLWLIMMIVYQAKFFNAPLRLRGEPLGHLLLFAVLPPLWSFCLYFVLILFRATCDPMLRRHVLYPAELRARQGANYSKISHWSNGVTRYLKYSCVRMPNLFY